MSEKIVIETEQFHRLIGALNSIADSLHRIEQKLQ